MVWHAAGISGLKSVYEEILGSGEKEFLIFASRWDRESPELSQLIDEQIERQYRANMRSRALVVDLPEVMNAQWQKTLAKKGIRIRGCSPTYKLPAQILIWGSTVAITTFHTELLTMVIRHPDIAETHRQLFEEMWKKGKDPVL